MTVEAPPGHVVGYVSQAWSLCKPRFKIENAEGETVLRIKGPCCQWEMCGDIEFDVSCWCFWCIVGSLSTGTVKSV